MDSFNNFAPNYENWRYSHYINDADTSEDEDICYHCGGQFSVCFGLCGTNN